MTELKMEELYVDDPCVVSFFTGELGWFIQRWQGYLRNLKITKYPDHKFIVMMNNQFHPLVHDFVNYTVDLPKEFYDINLETDCYEAPPPNSKPGSLTPPEVYKNLIDYFRSFYNVEKAEEIWTPRGYDDYVDKRPQTFIKYASDEEELNLPLVVVFPRARTRASNRNVPEYIWKEIVDILKKKLFVVISGTPSGASLGDYKADNVLNLINYSGDDKLEKTMHYLHHAAVSLSSQSGTTHLSLLCGTPSYIIGHERMRHSIYDNRFKAPVLFRELQDYRAVSPKEIIGDVELLLNTIIGNGILTEDLTRSRIGNKKFIKRPSIRTLVGKKDLIGAEIGVDLGDNAINMLENLQIKKLYLIDPYRIYGIRNAGNNLSQEQCDEIKQIAHDKLDARYSDKIVWIEDLSENAYKQIKEKLDFVYIDGCHTYNYVMKDLDIYFDMVKEDGLVAGHDFDSKSVNEAVHDFFTKRDIKFINQEKCSDVDWDWWYIRPTGYDTVINEHTDTLNSFITEIENGS